MKFQLVLSFILLLTPFLSNAQWEVETLPDGRSEISSVAIDDNIYFIGGALSGVERYMKMNIYNVPSKSWTTVDVPNGTKGSRTISIGKKIYFGDIEGDRTIYVYDTIEETWNEISVPGTIGTLTYMDNLIIVESSGDLMVYNLDTEECTDFEFPYNPNATVAAANGKIVIAGGSGNIVRIYDVETEEWTESELSLERDEPKAVSHNNRVFFVGGEADGFDWTGRIDIYDTESNTWSIDSLSRDRNRFGITVYDDKLIVAGGQRISFSGQYRAEVDILDLNTDTWENIEMPTGRRHTSVVGHNGKLYIAGGDDSEDNLDVIEIYDFLSVSNDNISILDINIYPNPALDVLTITSEQSIEKIEVLDINGRVINNYKNPNLRSLDISDLEAGVYFLRINKEQHHLKFIKI